MILSPGRYRVLIPAAQEPIFASWEYSEGNVAHSESGAGPRVVRLRRQDNGLFHKATEVTYWFEVRDTTEWPAALPAPSSFSGDPYRNDAEAQAGYLIGGVLLLGGAVWGAHKLLRRRRRR